MNKFGPKKIENLGSARKILTYFLKTAMTTRNSALLSELDEMLIFKIMISHNFNLELWLLLIIYFSTTLRIFVCRDLHSISDNQMNNLTLKRASDGTFYEIR